MKLAKAILILEDDAPFRELLIDLFRSRGLEGVGAASAVDASTILELNDPLMAIVDYNLPDMDGINWITKIRERGKNFPVVFITGGWLDERTFSWLRNILRVALILRKPIVPELFMQQIETLLPANTMSATPLPVSSSGGHKDLDVLNKLASLDKKIESAATGSSELEQLRQERSKLEREEKLSGARANYAKELSISWQELSKAVSTAQQEDTNANLLNEAVSLAHKIRGTAGSMGFSRVGKAAEKVEELTRGLDPTDTLKEVMWTEIFRALADGETCVREVGEAIKSPETKEEISGASKVLLLGQQSKYMSKVFDLKTSSPVEIEISESAIGSLQMAKRMAFEMAILDLQGLGVEKLAELTRELREVPGQEALPIAFVSSNAELLNSVDRTYLGCSMITESLADKATVEKVVEKLLMHRQVEKPRILTVDDDPVLTKFITTILSAENMLVEQLNKPIAIMETMEKFKPDLVILDVMMPGLSGYDVCRMLRSHDIWKDLPILFLTSKSDQEGRAAAFQAGGNDFLSKPVLAEELIARANGQLQIAYNKMGRVSDKDPTTLALHGNAFVVALNEMIETARTNNTPVTVCLMTIDDFMRLSLAHTWASAQSALGCLGKLIHSRFRAEDLRGRLGEDTLAIALPGVTMENVSGAMAKLLEEFANEKVPNETGGTFKATFSAGLAEFSTDGSSSEALLNIASQRLLSYKLARRGVIAPAALS